MRNNFSIKLSYIRNLFAKEYKKIEEYCILEKKQHIQIGPEEGKLLSLFIKIQKSKVLLRLARYTVTRRFAWQKLY